MNRQTVDRLLALNREFYRSSAAAFDASRRSPWPGWQRVLAAIDPSRAVSILDVGCGNGRFGLLAAETLGDRLSYCGVDGSAELLEAARQRGADDWQLIERDVFADPLPPGVDGRGFDAVVCFGVMHHVPARRRRRDLVERMAARLAVGGVLAVSFWQFGGEERFLSRVEPWSRLRSPSGDQVDTSELEPGDYLLRWGDGAAGEAPLRYCHYCDPTEARELVAELGLEPIDSFRADGRSGDLNLYHLLRRGR